MHTTTYGNTHAHTNPSNTRKKLVIQMRIDWTLIFLNYDYNIFTRNILIFLTDNKEYSNIPYSNVLNRKQRNTQSFLQIYSFSNNNLG